MFVFIFEFQNFSDRLASTFGVRRCCLHSHRYSTWGTYTTPICRIGFFHLRFLLLDVTTCALKESGDIRTLGAWTIHLWATGLLNKEIPVNRLSVFFIRRFCQVNKKVPSEQNLQNLGPKQIPLNHLMSQTYSVLSGYNDWFIGKATAQQQFKCCIA